MKKLKVLLAAAAVLICSNAFAEMLSIDDYMNLVVKNNADLLAVQSNIDAVKGKIAEIERAYSFFFTIGGSYTDDQSGRPYSPAGLTTNEIKYTAYDASVSKQFGTGTKMSLGLNGAYSQNNTPAINYSYHDIAPAIKLEQSLWKEFNGGATKANIAKARADAQSALWMLEYKKQSILLSAKMAYWSLSYTRTVVDFRQVSLDRTKKILEWNQTRYNKDLGEKADVLQSQAAYQLRALNLKLSKEDQARAERTFNNYLNSSEDRVLYDVSDFTKVSDAYISGKTITRKGQRADLLSALSDAESAKYAAVASGKNMGADLVLSGQYSLNGVDAAFGTAKDYILNADKPAWTVALRYTLPLDFSLRGKISQGYQSAITAAQKTADAAKVREENAWQQLVADWNNAKTRYELVQNIKEIQYQTSVETQNLLNKGRSTTYLVLQSQQNLDDATLNVFQSILELISIYEQANTLYKN